MNMRSSPRTRRLAADYEAMQKLDRESSILSFHAMRTPPDVYHVTFRGVGLWRMQNGEIALRNVHEVTIELAAAYPRLIPNLSWKTPIFHPNISSSGVVCLGGYGTNWVPSLMLDELCTMLWDMIRYRNFDTESPYNKDAAIWTRSQTKFQFPLDVRSLRDQVSGEAPSATIEPIRNVMPPPVVANPIKSNSQKGASSQNHDRPAETGSGGTGSGAPGPAANDARQPAAVDDQEVQIVNASVVDNPKSDDQDEILFID